MMTNPSTMHPNAMALMITNRPSTMALHSTGCEASIQKVMGYRANQQPEPDSIEPALRTALAPAWRPTGKQKSAKAPARMERLVIDAVRAAVRRVS
jgi:hypothetical protein